MGYKNDRYFGARAYIFWLLSLIMPLGLGSNKEEKERFKCK
jgi:hypothetical protein